MNEINIGREYTRSDKPYDVVKVIDILVKDGRCTIKCLESYGMTDGPFFVGPEDTKHWRLF